LKDGIYTMVDVPDSHGNPQQTALNGINASGQLAGTYLVDNGTSLTFHAFFGNKGGFMTLDPPGSIRTVGGFINAQGQVVGTFRRSDQKRHGFIWRNGFFTTFNVPGDHPVFGTVALGINDIGEVVGVSAPI
jgi:probable HAF family extracellular repeat protein